MGRGRPGITPPGLWVSLLGGRQPDQLWIPGAVSVGGWPGRGGIYCGAWQVLQRFAARTMRPHLLQRLVFLASFALV